MSPTFAEHGKRQPTGLASEPLAIDESGYRVVGLGGLGSVVGSVMTGTMGTGWGQARGQAIQIVLGENHPAARPVVEYRDGSIYVDSAQMEIDVPIPIRYRGQPAIAVKRADESVEFYRLPSKRRLGRPK